MTSLCASQGRRRYVSNETPNNVSMERRQDVSGVRLHDVLLVCHDDISRGYNEVSRGQRPISSSPRPLK